MSRAYRFVTDLSIRHVIHLVAVHPAAVPGGLNTSDGVTNYIEHLLHKRFWRVSFVCEASFPVVYVDSLAPCADRAAYTVPEEPGEGYTENRQGDWVGYLAGAARGEWLTGT